jgi:hypothetical protein
MTTVEQSERFTRLPDEETLAATVVASKSTASVSTLSTTSMPPAKLSSPASPKARP